MKKTTKKLLKTIVGTVAEAGVCIGGTAVIVSSAPFKVPSGPATNVMKEMIKGIEIWKEQD